MPRPAPRRLDQLLDASFVDLEPWICPDPEALGGCPPVVGGVIVNRQGSHLTGSYVRSLTPILHHELVVTGLATMPLEEIEWVASTDPAAD